MQGTAQASPWINTLITAAIGLLGGILGYFANWLANRREASARTEKIRIEIVGQEIDNYKAFSEAMRAMRQDVSDAESKLRQARHDKEKLEKQNENLMAQNRSLEKLLRESKRQ